jgi:DNA-binding MarR family transcriptional regulator
MKKAAGGRPPTRKEASLAVARLMPHIMRGIQLEFFVRRGITQTQFLLLSSIRAYTRCTMSTLARSLHVSLPTVSGVVDRLVRSGFIRRVPQADDRRQSAVELTAKGESFFRDFEAVVRRRWEEVLVTLDPHELEAFHHVITKLRQHLQADAQ